MTARTGFLPFPKGFETELIHHAHNVNQWKDKAIVPHIVTSTVYHIDDPENPPLFKYGRMQNPTRYVLEQVMTKIHGGKIGYCYSSGMSALTCMLGLLKAGDHIVANEEMNGEVYDIFTKIAKNFGITTTFTDFTDPSCICNAVKDNTKMFYTENPSDPTMRITDIKTIGCLAKELKILFGVDNTCLTPYLQKPLELGADFVTVSATKYINGHSDNLMGSIVLKDDKYKNEMYTTQVLLGFVPAPFDCYQVIRGMKTLQIRMEDHQNKGYKIAQFLEEHPAVKCVLHPGLESHPQHELFKQQASGHSGIFSFCLKGDGKVSQEFIKKLNYFAISEAAGGIESTISIPSIMSHKTLPNELKCKLGISDNLIKISVGLENICDLLTDLDAALSGIGNDNEKKKC